MATTKKAAPKKATTKKATTKKVSKVVAKEKSKKGFFKTLIENVTGKIEDVSENVAEGATFVSEKVKETTAKAYVASTEFVEETNEKIHQFTDKQSLLKEKKRLEEGQAELTSKFGEITLMHYLKNDSLHKTFLNTNTVNDLVLEYKAREKQLISVKKSLKKLE